MAITADSSSLILLAKASILETVAKLSEMIISTGVYNESVVQGKEKGKQDSLLIENLISSGKLGIRDAPRKKTKELKKSFGIRAGENETVAIAIKEKYQLLITDDKKCITVCKVLNIKFMIALDIVLDLYANRKISYEKAVDAFRQIKKYGWIGEDIIENRWKKLEELKNENSFVKTG